MAFRSLLSDPQPNPTTNDMEVLPFERYDEEFIELTEQVRKSIDDMKQPQTDLESGDMTLNLLSQCDDLLKQMSVEARGVDDASVKRDLLGKVRACKEKLSALRGEYDAAKTELERGALLSGGGGGRRNGGSNEHRERLLRTNEQLAAQNDTLENARRVMAETEDVAMEITSELSRNREKIESSHIRVREVSGMTNQARRIIQNMSRREVQQKLVTYAVAVILVIVVLFIMFGMK